MKPPVTEKVQQILSHHPKLALTRWQAELLTSDGAKNHGWQNQLALHRNVSRQTITNVLRTARRKVEAAQDLAALSQGAILPVFRKYSTGWATEPMRNLLWDALRPNHDRRPSAMLQSMLLPIQERLVSESLGLLSNAVAHKQRVDAHDGGELALAYNMLITAAHIEPENPKITRLLSAFDDEMGKHSWIVHRFIRRALHLFDHQACEQHRLWLREKIATPDAQGKRFATYALLYYGGAPEQIALRFLESDGLVEPRVFSYAPVLARLYTNMQIPRYDSPLWDDINFLRLALLTQHIPLTPASLPPGSRNSIKTLCLQALRSRDLFVARQAERLLASLTTP